MRKFPFISLSIILLLILISYQGGVLNFATNNVKNVEITSDKINSKNSINNLYAQNQTINNSKSIVFMTTNINSKSLVDLYEALDREAKGNVAIKLHMGEVGNKNYISPNLVKDIALKVNGTFVDANTYYAGGRSTTKLHLQTAKDHGFTYAKIDILDSNGEIKLPIKNGKHLKEAIIGAGYIDYDFIISIAHFKGHAMAGFGGSLKNLAIGMASGINGKGAIHKNPGGGKWSSRGNVFLEKVVEYNKAIMDDIGDNIIYINVLNNLSIDCDCSSRAAHPQMKDIGILASTDPVALERASLDLIYKAPRKDSIHLINRIEAKNGAYIIDYAQQLGLGSKEYELINVNN